MPIRINPTLKQPFETRLVRYSLAVGALIAAPAAHASDIYWSGQLNSQVGAGHSLFVSFDPLAGGATDFTISVSSSEIDVTSGPGTAFDIGPLAFNTPITATASGTVALVEGLGGKSPSGPWLSQSGPAYLGVSFTVSSQQYLGWAELQLDTATPSATLVSYAYNEQPGGPINAGQAPEPASLSLFALGAAGVLALRRRRQARNGSFRKA